MLEAEVAFLTSVDQLMDVVEASVGHAARFLVQAGMEGAIWDKDEGAARDRARALAETDRKPWKRISYTDALEVLAAAYSSSSASSRPFSAPPPTWGQSLRSEHEKWLAGSWACGPVFVHDYPAALKPFYMLPSTAVDPSTSSSSASPSEDASRRTVACFDLLVPGMGELAGGSLREHRLEPLLEVMRYAHPPPPACILSLTDLHALRLSRERKMRIEPLDWYLDTRRYGTVPHGGYGMGFERFLCWISGEQDVRDVIGFPRWKGHCRF